MAFSLLGVVIVALALRAIAASGSAALYAPAASRTAARLESGATAAAVVAAAASALVLYAQLGRLGALAAPLVALVLAPIAVLAADLLPRSLAQASVEVLPPRVRAFAHRFLASACAPLRLVEAASARLTGLTPEHIVPTIGQVLSDLLRRETPGEEPQVSSPQVIRRILEFRDTRVHEVMVPLIHIYAVRDDAPIQAAINLVVREKVSRLPVFHERMYNIVGIVHSFDLLGESRTSDPVARVMRTPLYVPENKPAHRQLRLMQRRGVNMAVVVDEHGGTIGIVTVEDLLEEIVGEIEDEYDQREVLYETLPDGRVRVQGGMEIDRLNEIFPWQLPTGDYETFAGMVITQLGRIPRTGERLRILGLAIEVTHADARALREAIVQAIGEE